MRASVRGCVRVSTDADTREQTLWGGSALKRCDGAPLEQLAQRIDALIGGNEHPLPATRHVADAAGKRIKSGPLCGGFVVVL